MNRNPWNKLLEYETRDLLERFIRSRFNRDASARQVNEIAANFIQGREYFLNAERSGISVKPLLLYYGVSSLARGLILATSPLLKESDLKGSHGLSTVRWQESLSNKDIGSLSVCIKEGTFTELLKATSNETYFKHNSNSLSWKIGYDLPKIGQIVSFDDLVRTFSDLSEEFQIWRQSKLYYFRLDTFKSIKESNHLEYTVHCDLNIEGDVSNIFPSSRFPGLEVKLVDKKMIIKAAESTLPQFSQRFFDAFNMGMGEIVLTKAIEGCTQLSTLGQLYCLSFYLGMLSRYYPSVWISLGRTENGDAVYPLVIRSLELIEKQFPQAVLEFLGGPYDF